MQPKVLKGRVYINSMEKSINMIFRKNPKYAFSRYFRQLGE